MLTAKLVAGAVAVVTGLTLVSSPQAAPVKAAAVLLHSQPRLIRTQIPPRQVPSRPHQKRVKSNHSRRVSRRESETKAQSSTRPWSSSQETGVFL